MAGSLRLGMSVPPTETECLGCKQLDAYTRDSWHSLACVRLSGRAMTDRHNAVLHTLARFCSLLQVPVRCEPAGLHQDSNRRPDIQVALATGTLLGDVTIAHPATKSWAKVTNRHGVGAVGDTADARKTAKYGQMAKSIDMDFQAVVLYTYGGFHKSAMGFIDKLTGALDQATCIISRATFKRQLKQHIAIAVQRGNADIMIQDFQRQQQLLFPRSRRRAITRCSSRPPATPPLQPRAGCPHTDLVPCPLPMNMSADVAPDLSTRDELVELPIPNGVSHEESGHDTGSPTVHSADSRTVYSLDAVPGRNEVIDTMAATPSQTVCSIDLVPLQDDQKESDLNDWSQTVYSVSPETPYSLVTPPARGDVAEPMEVPHTHAESGRSQTVYSVDTETVYSIVTPPARCDAAEPMNTHTESGQDIWSQTVYSADSATVYSLAP